jgi:dTDP-4-dehydrorhamnose reductase
MSTETGPGCWKPEIWGGIECTINRVKDSYSDQLEYSGHYDRLDDLDKIAALGITKLRYPVLWERHQPCADTKIDWTWVSGQLERIRALGIQPVAGLLHHGSGPSFTRLDDKQFPQLLAEYAFEVATQFPWIEYYTPVNEPLTTARFSGLYGFWYPHHENDRSFLKMLLNQLKGTVLSMKRIREVNPSAKLVQTEDLAYSSSTKKLQYQAVFENHRRWLTYDLLCGKVDQQHPLWAYMTSAGITNEEILFFRENPCPPDILGLNYYVTSERWLDEDLEKYPGCTHGGNAFEKYADTEAVRYGQQKGLSFLLKETWERYQLPLAITECHLQCSREEQLRWFKETWDICTASARTGVNVTAVTAWSLMGAYNWNSLLRRNEGVYESGVFDLREHKVRATALAKMIHELARNGRYEHPLIHQKGWWHQRPNKIMKNDSSPLLIVGKNGTLARAFAKICEQRSIPYKALSRTDMDINDLASVGRAFDLYKPWAMINTTGFVRVDDAESETAECFRVNADGPGNMAGICSQKGIPFMTFSSDLVFDGSKNAPYLEEDEVKSLSVYGASKALGELKVKKENPGALIIRTSGFFGPWDQYNFVHQVLSTIKNGNRFAAASDIVSSPTYVPDLVNYSLDLFIDEESGIWHLTNDGIVSWAELAERVALRAGYTTDRIKPVNASTFNWKARRPGFSVLQSEKGIRLPYLDNALDRYFMDQSV